MQLRDRMGEPITVGSDQPLVVDVAYPGELWSTCRRKSSRRWPTRATSSIALGLSPSPGEETEDEFVFLVADARRAQERDHRQALREGARLPAAAKSATRSRAASCASTATRSSSAAGQGGVGQRHGDRRAVARRDRPRRLGARRGRGAGAVWWAPLVAGAARRLCRLQRLVSCARDSFAALTGMTANHPHPRHAVAQEDRALRRSMPGKVGMYVCGPTVYDFIHIGNGRTFIAFDLVARHLRARGYRRHLRAQHHRRRRQDHQPRGRAGRRSGGAGGALHRRVPRRHGRRRLHRRPTSSRASPRHIAEIIAMIDKLIEQRRRLRRRTATSTSRCGNFPPYGQLSQQPLDELEAGARVEVDARRSASRSTSRCGRRPSRASRRGRRRGARAARAGTSSARPWPSATSATTFDLHGGGVDLIFPHHENERAQSLGAHGGAPSRASGCTAASSTSAAARSPSPTTSMKVLFKRAFKLRAAPRASRRRGAALLLLDHALPQPAHLRRPRRGRRSRPRRCCASPGSKTPSAAASTPTSRWSGCASSSPSASRPPDKAGRRARGRQVARRAAGVARRRLQHRAGARRVERGARPGQPHPRRQTRRAQGRQAPHARAARARSRRRLGRARARRGRAARLARRRIARAAARSSPSTRPRRGAHRRAQRRAQAEGLRPRRRAARRARQDSIEIMDTPPGTRWRVS